MKPSTGKSSSSDETVKTGNIPLSNDHFMFHTKYVQLRIVAEGLWQIHFGNVSIILQIKALIICK